MNWTESIKMGCDGCHPSRICPLSYVFTIKNCHQTPSSMWAYTNPSHTRSSVSSSGPINNHQSHVHSTCPITHNLILTATYQRRTTRSTMVSLRFPFSFSQPPNPRHRSSNSFSAAATAFSVAAASGAAVAAAVAVSQNPINPFLQNAFNFFSNHSSPFWASLSIADNPSSVSESKTGVFFPSILNDSRQLLGTGLRKKSVLGLKNIDVYAFGTAFLYYHLKSIQCFSSILCCITWV